MRDRDCGASEHHHVIVAGAELRPATGATFRDVCIDPTNDLYRPPRYQP